MSISPTTFGVSSIAPVQHQMSGPSRQIKRCEDRVSDSCRSHPGKAACCIATAVGVGVGVPVPNFVCNENDDGGTMCQIPFGTFIVSRVPTCGGFVYSAQPVNGSECDKNE